MPTPYLGHLADTRAWISEIHHTHQPAGHNRPAEWSACRRACHHPVDLELVTKYLDRIRRPRIQTDWDYGPPHPGMICPPPSRRPSSRGWWCAYDGATSIFGFLCTPSTSKSLICITLSALSRILWMTERPRAK